MRDRFFFEKKERGAFEKQKQKKNGILWDRRVEQREKSLSLFLFQILHRFTIFGVTLLNKSLYTMIISTIIFPREFIFPVTKTIS